MNLRLPLKTKWFEMTKSGIKLEDYREINGYWCRRLLNLKKDLDTEGWQKLIKDLSSADRKFNGVKDCLFFYGALVKSYTTNTMTLGYPKNTDTDKILNLEHGGIEIREGNPDWGAELNKVYFVILHKKK